MLVSTDCVLRWIADHFLAKPHSPYLRSVFADSEIGLLQPNLVTSHISLILAFGIQKE